MTGCKSSLILFTIFIHFGYFELGGTTDLTIQVPAGQEECFYEAANTSQTLTLDYSVISSSQGEHDINFQVSDPHNRPMITEFRKADSSHSLPVTVEGLHKICFDNTFSHFSTKTIAFGIAAEYENELNWKSYENYLEPEASYDVNIEDIQGITNRVRVHMSVISRLQQEFREVESRDRSVIEHNYERINFWSFVNLIIVVFVGIVQVITLKGLFDPKYAISNLLKFSR